MQQFIACFEGRAYKQKTTLFLMVIDIGFDGWYIETELCSRNSRKQSTDGISKPNCALEMVGNNDKSVIAMIIILFIFIIVFSVITI